MNILNIENDVVQTSRPQQRSTLDKHFTNSYADDDGDKGDNDDLNF